MSDELPDILAKNLAVIFCGINPGATAAAAGRHFVNPSNRFWRVLHLAGFTPMQIHPQDDHTILQYGYGLTTAVARPTRRAGDLSRLELTSATGALREKIEGYAPRMVAFLGKAAYAAIVDEPVLWGPQAGRFAGVPVWVLPNPSGLNRNFNLTDLVQAYKELREAVAAGSIT
ncbi:MAG: mismatch-specific DNA-glycosylase [Hyphomicrobiales bacterium]|nr:mismatch-specific DNA-glycosylase [Hyphomicrobiales bacterium]